MGYRHEKKRRLVLRPDENNELPERSLCITER